MGQISLNRIFSLTYSTVKAEVIVFSKSSDQSAKKKVGLVPSFITKFIFAGLLSLLLNGIGRECLGQPVEFIWQNSFGGSNDDVCYYMEQTDDGGFITVGLTWSMDFDVSDAEHFREALLVKYDSAGTPQWHQTFGGTLTDHSFFTIQTDDGGYIMAMESQSEDGDVPYNLGNQDFVCLKLDSLGNPEWTRVYGGSRHDHPSCIIQTPDGGYLLAGGSHSSDGDIPFHYGDTTTMDIWLLKLNDEGDIEWSKIYGGTQQDMARYVMIDDEGNFLIVGEAASDDIDFTDHHGSTFTFDLYVMKTDAQGELIWLKSYGGIKDEGGHYAYQLPNSNYIIIGYTNSTDGDVSFLHGGNDLWLLEINATGELQWEQTHGGTHADYGKFVQPTIDGKILLIGETASTDQDVEEPLGEMDFWILKTEADGTLLWEKSIGGTADDFGRAGIQLASGEYVIAGTVHSNDGMIEGHLGSTLRSDSWIAKVNIEDLATEVGNYVGDPPPSHLFFYDNPASLLTSFRFTTSETQVVQWKLFTADGRKVLSAAPAMFAAGEHYVKLSTREFSPGIYFFVLQSGDEVMTAKMTVAR
jgi:hypothetical protein